MKRKLLLFMSILLLILSMVACSPNEKGFLGPSWDVELKVPLLKDKGKTLDELLQDMPEEFVIPETAGEVIEFKTDLSEDVNLPKYEFSEIFTSDVSVPDFDFGSGTINLPTIESNISGGYLIDPNTEISVPNTNGNEGTIDDQLSIDLSFPGFTSMTFNESSSKSISVEIEVTGATDFTVDEFTFNFGDGSATFTDINVNDPVQTAEIPLAGLTMTSGNDISTTIKTSGTDSEANLDLQIVFPDNTKISKVEGFVLEQAIYDEINPGSISLDADFPEGLKEIGFKTGSEVNVNIDAPSSVKNYLNYDFSFFNLSDDNNDGTINLAESKLDISGSTEPYINFSLVMDIPAGETIDYDATAPIDVSGGLTNNGIASATLDFSKFEISSQNQIDEKLFDKSNMDIPEELSNLEFNNAKFTMLFDGITDVAIDLSTLKVQALNSNNQVVDPENSDSLEFNLGEVTGDNAEIELMDLTPNILDLVLNKNTSSVVVKGEWNIVGEATIDAEETIGFNGMSVDIPFSFKVTEDIAYDFAPQKLEAFDSEQIDMIKQGVKEGKVVLKEFENDLGVSVDAKLYLASIDGGDMMTEEDLKTNLYKEENIFKTLSVQQRTTENIELGISDEDLNEFTKDNLYFGVKIIIPASDQAYELRTGDKINIGEIFATMVGKVNQFEF